MFHPSYHHYSSDDDRGGPSAVKHRTTSSLLYFSVHSTRAYLDDYHLTFQKSPAKTSVLTTHNKTPKTLTCYQVRAPQRNAKFLSINGLSPPSPSRRHKQPRLHINPTQLRHTTPKLHQRLHSLQNPHMTEPNLPNKLQPRMFTQPRHRFRNAEHTTNDIMATVTQIP